jgi:hypothetical protein
VLQHDRQVKVPVKQHQQRPRQRRRKRARRTAAAGLAEQVGPPLEQVPQPALEHRRDVLRGAATRAADDGDDAERDER